MNKQFTWALFVLVPLLSFGQDSVLEPAASTDSVSYNKVMVIPFNPTLYISDCNHELMKANKKNGEEIIKAMRYGLDYDLNARIVSIYETHDLLKDTAVDVQKDLQSIYGGISYKFDKPLRPDEVEDKRGKKRKEFFRNLRARVAVRDKGPQSDNSPEARWASSYKEDPPAEKYFNVKIYNPDMLTYLNEKYGTDLFVFINQVELVTNYEKCLDRANGVFEREVRVHFSVFNKNAKQLYGDVITVTFPSNTNSLDNIINSNFPMISEYLAAKLPQPPVPVVPVKDDDHEVEFDQDTDLDE
jgi:hypothetical protein